MNYNFTHFKKNSKLGGGGREYECLLPILEGKHEIYIQKTGFQGNAEFLCKNLWKPSISPGISSCVRKNTETLLHYPYAWITWLLMDE